MNMTELEAAGMNVDEFLGRVMQNTALVKILVKKFSEDKNYEELSNAISRDDMKAAEMHCHTLKGMCGNMALTELFSLFVEQLAFFRAGDTDSAKALMPGISECYLSATCHINKWIEENS